MLKRHTACSYITACFQSSMSEVERKRNAEVLKRNFEPKPSCGDTPSLLSPSPTPSVCTIPPLFMHYPPPLSMHYFPPTPLSSYVIQYTISFHSHFHQLLCDQNLLFNQRKLIKIRIKTTRSVI